MVCMYCKESRDEMRKRKWKERYKKLFQLSCHSCFDILISSDEGLCAWEFKWLPEDTQWHSTQKKKATLAYTCTAEKLPALLTHALHTNFPSSLTIPTHYDGVLMNKSVMDTHANRFAPNALKVKTMSHLLCGNLSKQPE